VSIANRTVAAAFFPGCESIAEDRSVGAQTTSDKLVGWSSVSFQFQFSETLSNQQLFAFPGFGIRRAIHDP
jgi:hypothetical protein